MQPARLKLNRQENNSKRSVAVRESIPSMLHISEKPTNGMKFRRTSSRFQKWMERAWWNSKRRGRKGDLSRNSHAMQDFQLGQKCSPVFQNVRLTLYTATSTSFCKIADALSRHLQFQFLTFVRPFNLCKVRTLFLILNINVYLIC